MAGDLTIWGMRDNVKLIREDADGQRKVINLNLNKADIITNPYYYLQQNDILYVTPNKTKAKNSDIGQSTSLWFSGISILVSVVNIIVTFLVLR
jgi:polysaccharide export outer membrane protein